MTSPDLIYIAGYGRSGSTVLDAWLGAIDGFVATGEMHFLPQYLVDDRACSCGDALRMCAAWPYEGGPVSTARAAAVTTSIESSVLVGGARGRKTSQAERDDYASWWKWCIDHVKTATDSTTLVDSSKSMAASRHRVETLRDLCGLDVAVLHLVRDPRAVFVSAMKGDNSQYSRPFTGFEASIRSLVGWQVANRAALHHAATSDRYALLWYHEFTSAPEQTVVKALRELGVAGDLSLPGPGSIDPGHGVGGNRMRSQGREGIEVRADAAWRTRVEEPLIRAAHAVSTPTLRLLEASVR